MSQHPVDKVPNGQQIEEQESNQEGTSPLDEMPEEVQRSIEMMFSMQRSMGGGINPLAEKLTEEHLSKIIDIAGEDNSKSHDQTNSNRRALLWVLGGVAVIFLFMVIFLVLQSRDALLASVLTGLLGFLGGFGTGFGVKSHKNSD